MAVEEILPNRTDIHWRRNIVCCLAGTSGEAGSYAPLGSVCRLLGPKLARRLMADHGVVGVERKERMYLATKHDLVFSVMACSTRVLLCVVCL